ncbi:MAG TPA: PASTA domain-containing protein, partial [Solirubrobacteraceae bacterium]|nr:PASTA domain-containing protein [Solirubrobacteraceae bacterium]
MSETVVRCPTCSESNAAANHFCEHCGAYLAWGDLAEQRGEEPTQDLGTPRRDEPVLSLTVTPATAQPGDADTPLVLHVTPGGSAQLVARLRNESDIVDEFTLSVDGLPARWVTVPGEPIGLLPVGSQGGFEREVTLLVQPPRTSEARAGPWDFTVAARSHSLDRDVAAVEGELSVEPFAQLTARAGPQVVSARRRAQVTCAVTNTGNDPATVTLLADDPGDGCAVVLPRPTRIAPGMTAHLPVGLRATRARIIGTAALHPIQLSATTPGLEQPAVAGPVLFKRRPWIPWWVALLVLLLLLVALLLWTLRPREAVVPTVVGERTAFAAQKRLEAEGLHAPPKVVLVVAPKVKPSTVVDQSPRGGRKVPPETVVTLRVAAGPGRTVVPRVKG